MITRDIKTEVHPTIKELANEFCELDADAQAQFLSIVSEDFKSWGHNKMLIQISHISESKDLTFEAQKFIKELNNYVNND